MPDRTKPRIALAYNEIRTGAGSAGKASKHAETIIFEYLNTESLNASDTIQNVIKGCLRVQTPDPNLTSLLISMRKYNMMLSGLDLKKTLLKLIRNTESEKVREEAIKTAAKCTRFGIDMLELEFDKADEELKKSLKKNTLEIVSDGITSMQSHHLFKE